MDKPFNYGTLASGDYFTNREKETQRLINNFNLGINTVLISPRRWGKSSLVLKAAQETIKKEKKIKIAFLDLFAVRTEEEFYNYYASTLIKAASSVWDEKIELMRKVFKTVIPKVNLSPDPTADIAFSLNWEEIKKKPDEILDLAENLCIAKNIKIVVCIDEFQNISQFDSGNLLIKKLRSFWQKHTRASYCLYGSKRNMMLTLFENKGSAFYKFGDLILLHKIETQYWIPYIQLRFKATGKQISAEQAEAIALAMENHPYFVQQLALEVWYLTKETTAVNFLEEAIAELTIKNNILYQKELESLSSTQIGFLKAIIDGAQNFTSIEVLGKYKLGTAGNVKRIREALIHKEIIDFTGKKYEILDPVFKIWFRKNLMDSN